mgnify:CR=1 FL=1
MVKEIKKGNKNCYVCKACDMAYENRDLAQKCEIGATNIKAAI